MESSIGRKVSLMLITYIRAAMKRAVFEKLKDGTIYGRIPGFQGVWANAKTESACRRELQDVLEGWIILSLKRNLPLPVVEDIGLNEAAA